MEITNFKIKKLFGHIDVDLVVKENRLIIMGVNGTGKTNLLTMLFYFLRGDFVELSAYNFEEISVTINKKEYKISYANLEKSLFALSPKLIKLREKFPEELKYNVYSALLRKEFDQKDLEELVTPLFYKVANNRKIPKDVWTKQFTDIREEFHYINSEADFEIKQVLMSIKNELKDLEILFLPTFRRIEKEFHDVFGFTLPEELKERIEKNKANMGIINFGANDINEKFNQVFKDTMKKRLISDDDAVIFPKSENVKKFVEVCNHYLVDAEKEIFEEDNQPMPKILSSSQELPVQSLSSGEKQIISIFSELYLCDDDKEFIVLIDEPELSLSVAWQEKFLPDILASGKCKFLAAVTHSPFIYSELIESKQEISHLCLEAG